MGRRDDRDMAAPVVLHDIQGVTDPMLLFLVFVLVALWLLGMITTATFGGWLHILLVVAVIFLLIRVIRGAPI